MSPREGNPEAAMACCIREMGTNEENGFVRGEMRSVVYEDWRYGAATLRSPGAWRGDDM